MTDSVKYVDNVFDCMHPVEMGTFWRSTFNRVYMVHCSKFKDRLEPAMAELGRIGLLDSGIFSIKTTNPSYARYANSRVGMSDGAKSLSLAWLDICSEVVENGFDRVLIIEDDARFLNDLDKVKEIMSGIPCSGMSVLDWTHHCGIGNHEKSERLRSVIDRCDGRFFTPDPAFHGNLWSTTVVSMTGDGARLIMDFLEHGLVPVDWFQNNFVEVPGLTVSVSKTPVAKQKNYKGRQEDMDKWSLAQGQNPSDYAIIEQRKDSVDAVSGDKTKTDTVELSDLWKSKFDSIILFSCLDYPERHEFVMSELERVGIVGSGVLKVEYTAPIQKYMSVLNTGLGGYERTGLLDYKMAMYRVFRRELSLGSKTVLTIEDDASFIKNLEYLKAAVSGLPVSDVVKFDWVFDNNSGGHGDRAARVMELSALSSTPFYFEPDLGTHGTLWDSTAVAWSDKAMRYVMEKFSEGSPAYYIDDVVKQLLDPEFRKSEGLTVHVASTPLCVQLNYGRHQSPNSADFMIRKSCGQDMSIYTAYVSAGEGCVPGGDYTEVTIDWPSLFDGVYVTHYLPQDDRLEFLKSEFSRLGIPESMVHYRYAYPNRFSEIVTDKIKSEHGAGWNTVSGWTDAAMNNLALLHEARHMGSKRILLLENDVAFLKDLDFLRKALESVPADADLCQCEFFAIDDPVKQLECAGVGLSGNEYWEPGLYPQRGGACTILSSVGIDKFIEYWSKDPVPTDFVYRYLDCVKYHSRVRLAVQRPFESGAIAAANTLDGFTKKELSWYSIDNEKPVNSSTRECSFGKPSNSPAVILPSFPLRDDEVNDSMRTLSELLKKYRDYREPACLMAKAIHDKSSGSNTGIVRMLLEQGLRVRGKKPGLPVDDWCWNGGPEKLLSELDYPPGSPGSDQYIVI